ncbi:MAG TPA: diguanylate cyclase [Paucimonas sp.]|nr:diguanylate cyclase [Paucimonas sp.]
MTSAENSLDQQLQLFASVVRAVNAGLIVLDADQRIVLWNDWMERHAQQPASAMLGRSLTELFPELANGRLHQAVVGALKNNFSSLISQTLNKAPLPLYASAEDAAAGTRIQQAVQVMPLEFGNQPRHCLIQVTDVSMAVAREKQLREQALELQSQTLLDGLTGIANRRRFDAHMDDEFRRAKRNVSPLSLIMVDVDCFKSYNDNYGHQKGDECLIQIAGALTRVLGRPCDLLARYGGEEFMAILPDTNADGAMRIAEMMRREVEALELEHAFSSVAKRVTISLGVVTQIPQHNATVAHMIGAADRALYKAKHSGRNRAAAYGSGAS